MSGDRSGRLGCSTATRLQRRKWQKEGRLEHASDEVWIAAGFTYSTLIAEKADGVKNARTYEEVVPEHYRDFKKVFSEVESERLPEHKPWDHKIDLKPETPSEHRSKNYPMSVDEQREVDKFLKENVRKVTYNRHSHPSLLLSSLSKRRTGNYVSFRTTGGLTNGP
jgi:hypothetical protein